MSGFLWICVLKFTSGIVTAWCLKWALLRSVFLTSGSIEVSISTRNF